MPNDLQDADEHQDTRDVRATAVFVQASDWADRGVSEFTACVKSSHTFAFPLMPSRPINSSHQCHSSPVVLINFVASPLPPIVLSSRGQSVAEVNPHKALVNTRVEQTRKRLVRFL